MKRRGFLRAALSSAAAVAAYNPVQRVWASQCEEGSIEIPDLDGQLVLAGALLQEAADDFGHIISEAPVAVLIPGSVDDICKLVDFARANCIKIGGMSMIGNTHSTYGQSQVGGGVVIDMSSLAVIHEVNADNALVDAGVRWSELLEETVPLGKSPPTLTDYVDLSIGGTISVGGVGGQVSRYGMQVDNVVELEVVTGRGKLVTCSPTKRRRLFNAVRSGLGQFGIIVRARVRLIDVPSMARRYSVFYSELADMMSDQETVIEDERFDYVEGFAERDPVTFDWRYRIELVKYFAPGQEPDDDALLGDLIFDKTKFGISVGAPPQLQYVDFKQDTDIFAFFNRLAFLPFTPLWTLPHPWIDTFVPGEEAESFIRDSVLESNDLAPNGPFDVILIYPFKRAKVTAPFMALPDSERCYLFSLLRSVVPPDTTAQLVAENRAIYEQLRELGGKRYAISSVPFDQDDWKDHFGDEWFKFVLRKLRFDPDNVLTPGQNIFSW